MPRFAWMLVIVGLMRGGVAEPPQYGKPGQFTLGFEIELTNPLVARIAHWFDLNSISNQQLRALISEQSVKEPFPLGSDELDALPEALVGGG